MSWERYGGLRVAIAQLAAQIMYGEEVKQYFTAKRIAAKRLLGADAAKTTRYRPRDLPSNGEIKQALLELVLEIEGSAHAIRLFAMRVVALEAMEALAPFAPRLIGSVATGHVRSGSDVDLHVFAADPSEVEQHVRALGWVHELQRVSIVKHGKAMEFTHLQVPDVFPIELTVHAPNELRNRPRSGTDGKPIVRIRDATLRAMCEREHPELWRRYLAEGAVPTLEEIAAAEERAEVDSWLDEDEVAAPPDRDPWEVDDAEAPEDGPADADAGEYEEDEAEPRIRRLEPRRRGGRAGPARGSRHDEG